MFMTRGVAEHELNILISIYQSKTNMSIVKVVKKMSLTAFESSSFPGIITGGKCTQ